MIDKIKTMFTENLVPTLIVMGLGLIAGVFVSKPIKKFLHLK